MFGIFIPQGKWLAEILYSDTDGMRPRKFKEKISENKRGKDKN